MSPYLFTIAFLTLMTLLTSSEMKRFSENSAGVFLYKQHQENSVIAEELQAFSKIAEFRDIKTEKSDPDDSGEKTKKGYKTRHVKKSTPLNFNLARPPNNSRLNLGNIFFLSKFPEEISFYEIAARLMRTLYENEEFFRQIPGVEYQILDAIIQKKHECDDFIYPDELCQLDFENTDLQEVFYLMMKGSANYQSFLNFITFDLAGEKSDQRSPKNKINLMFASNDLLRAIFQNDKVVEQIINLIQEQWETIIYQETHRKDLPIEEVKGRKHYKKLFTKKFKDILDEHRISESYHKLFDYGLGRQGDFLFIEDPLSGAVTREKSQGRSRYSQV